MTSFFLLLLVASAVFQAGCSPVSARILKPLEVRGVVPADSISKYSTNYFLDSAKFTPPADTCLFYTATLTGAALRRSREAAKRLTTIWDVWPCDHYNNQTTSDNRLRDIMGNPNQRYTYFENMSRAFAQLCDGAAFLLTKDVRNIPTDGIWGRIEEPVLKLIGNIGGQVNEIDASTENVSSWTDLWRRWGFSGGLRTQGRRRNSKRQPMEPQAETCHMQNALVEMFLDIPW